MNKLDETMELIVEVAFQEVMHYLDEPKGVSKGMAHKVGLFLFKNKKEIVDSAMKKLEGCKK